MKQSFFLLSLLLFLLLFHDFVICGAQKGLLLWYQILIPSLLPFIIVTNALSETNSYSHMIKFLHPVFKSHTNEFIVILLGNLCGYPIGGKILEQFQSKKLISSERKELLLPFVSQASPMFIIGYIYPHILEKKYSLPVFLLSIYLPTIIGYFFSIRKQNIQKQQSLTVTENKINITDSFFQAAKTMVLIGIYVMLFSIAYEILLPVCRMQYLKVPLSSLEITTGLSVLKKAYQNTAGFLPMVGMLTTFGGFCSIFQMQCVIHFEKKKYLQTKLFLSAGTFLILLLYEIIKTFYP